MAFVNYNNKEITVKIVYYGPALSGKTTCLKEVFNSKEFKKKGKLITLDTDGDRTLFFDFLPIEIGNLGNYSIKVQLYTVPGQVAYNTTRKLVLQGADGIVFVADSQKELKEQNNQSFLNLKENLKVNNIPFDEIPVIFQYNKRDLKDILSIDSLNDDLNSENKPFFPTIATTGENIHEALHAIMKMVIIYLKNKLTIFQKDKTVMFSKEEITSLTPESVEDGKANINSGDTEEEENVMELTSPLLESKSEAMISNEDEIFNLNDELPEIEIPEEYPEKEEDLRTVLKEKSVQIVLEKNELIKDKKNNKKSDKKKDITKTISIPLKIDVPNDGDELKLIINLDIKFEK